MNDRRWTYKVLKLKPRWVGPRAGDIEAALAPLGLTGWELVNAVQMGLYTWLYLKKEL